MISSGTTALATSSDAAAAAFDSGALPLSRVTFINEGSVAGFFSVDGGITWGRLPATASVTVKISPPAPVIASVKRVESGSNLATVWAFGT